MKKPRTVVGAATTSTVTRPECCSSRSWGDLPKDIIDSILGRLTLLADYDRFGAVCSTWRHASLDPINRNRRIESSLSSSVPLLILPPDDVKSRKKKPWKLTLFDVVRGTTIVNMELTSLPIPDSGERFYGSTHGWLIFADRYFSFTLINPFYTGGGGGIICLPPLPDQQDNEIGKVVLSSDPALSPNDYMAFVIYGSAKKVLFIKPGYSKYWKSINRRDSFMRPEDVVVHNGVVYAVDQHRGFYICDNINMESAIHRFDMLCVAPPRLILHGPNYDTRCYTVPSPDGNELFLVYMSILPEFQRRQFRVYKLLLSSAGPAPWLEMKSNLGNNNSMAIILGRNHSVCIDIKSCSTGGFQPNSIYFLNDMLVNGLLSMDPRSQDVGIFNLEDRSIRKCYGRDDRRDLCLVSPPAWLFPSLPGNWRKQIP